VGALAADAGDWAHASIGWEQATGQPWLGDFASTGLMQAQGNLLAGNTDECARALALIREKVAGTPDLGTHFRAYAAACFVTVAAVTGDLQDVPWAVSLAEAALASPTLAPVYCLPAYDAIALAACLRNDVEAARRLRMDTTWFVPYAREGSVIGDAALARLALVVGKPEEALREYRASRERVRHSVTAYAWTTQELGAMLAGGSSAAERDEGRSLLEEDLALARKYGLPPVEKRAREVLGRLEGGNAPRPDGLTDRELEVLRLLAAGKTDKEIAFELHISVKTASNHVGNVLAKTRSGNRTEAARYAMERGLAG
jgi:DNA-binding NarL/FixJ family response regulator